MITIDSKIGQDLIDGMAEYARTCHASLKGRLPTMAYSDCMQLCKACITLGYAIGRNSRIDDIILFQGEDNDERRKRKIA